ncbi:uncharacterized protein LOC135822275 isoform X1 [Sycon ciliatum]|uniref:uncharacterized protein LOC135822275 isoform X1 n=2 Tax=Sycon ciliatum TaxID=27933 RepID=UPI0031F60123
MLQAGQQQMVNVSSNVSTDGLGGMDNEESKLAGWTVAVILLVSIANIALVLIIIRLCKGEKRARTKRSKEQEQQEQHQLQYQQRRSASRSTVTSTLDSIRTSSNPSYQKGSTRRNSLKADQSSQAHSLSDDGESIAALVKNSFKRAFSKPDGSISSGSPNTAAGVSPHAPLNLNSAQPFSPPENNRWSLLINGAESLTEAPSQNYLDISWHGEITQHSLEYSPYLSANIVSNPYCTVPRASFASARGSGRSRSQLPDAWMNCANKSLSRVHPKTKPQTITDSPLLGKSTMTDSSTQLSAIDASRDTLLTAVGSMDDDIDVQAPLRPLVGARCIQSSVGTDTSSNAPRVRRMAPRFQGKMPRSLSVGNFQQSQPNMKGYWTKRVAIPATEEATQSPPAVILTNPHDDVVMAGVPSTHDADILHPIEQFDAFSQASRAESVCQHALHANIAVSSLESINTAHAQSEIISIKPLADVAKKLNSAPNTPARRTTKTMKGSVQSESVSNLMLYNLGCDSALSKSTRSIDDCSLTLETDAPSSPVQDGSDKNTPMQSPPPWTIANFTYQSTDTSF